ncbi:MAG: SDR family NAD(P)-dependent oxidoreductase [Candidatus Riflebacteria bacterium]|nr:SDR family NAD(P)-dependent oxidoreductase [Candidatus Riflebacteria bacterium]
MADSAGLNAIIIGATSGIGKAMAELLIRNGYRVGVTGRRTELLDEIQKQHGANMVCRQMDVDCPETASQGLESLIRDLGDVDLIVVSAGTGVINPELAWEPEATTIATNVTGFAAMATTALKYFLKRGKGHLVGISSVAALRGSSDAPAYNASKAFVCNYLEGLRIKAMKSGKPIFVTDILPGFVATRMAQGEGLFWIATPEKAALQIFAAIRARRRRAFITRRWRLIAFLLRFMPDFILEKI